MGLRDFFGKIPFTKQPVVPAQTVTGEWPLKQASTQDTFDNQHLGEHVDVPTALRYRDRPRLSR